MNTSETTLNFAVHVYLSVHVSKKITIFFHLPFKDLWLNLMKTLYFTAFRCNEAVRRTFLASPRTPPPSLAKLRHNSRLFNRVVLKWKCRKKGNILPVNPEDLAVTTTRKKWGKRLRKRNAARWRKGKRSEICLKKRKAFASSFFNYVWVQNTTYCLLYYSKYGFIEQ